MIRVQGSRSAGCRPFGGTVDRKHLSAEQPIVVGVAADPEPDDPIGRFGAVCPIVHADASRPELPYLLEAKRGMPGIPFQKFERAIGEIPNLGRQGPIGRPEVGRRVMGQRGVVLPAA